jgi:RNA polymerase sigma-70 factor (ECF subfamily)
VRTVSEGDDAELMQRYARGDVRAFETLYARHRAPLYRYLSRQTRDRAAADDLFQETWSRVIASRERYEPRAKFQTYLFHIAHNCFIDHCRRSAARREMREDEERGLAESLPAAAHERPDALGEQAQLRARFRAALEQLPAEQRDAFLLYEESGLSVEEIAAVTGVGPETAKSRLRYAVAKLRRALEADGVAPRIAAEEPGA